jgi:hypothetical protein
VKFMVADPAAAAPIIAAAYKARRLAHRARDPQHDRARHRPGGRLLG